MTTRREFSGRLLTALAAGSLVNFELLADKGRASDSDRGSQSGKSGKTRRDRCDGPGPKRDKKDHCDGTGRRGPGDKHRDTCDPDRKHHEDGCNVAQDSCEQHGRPKSGADAE